MYFQLLPQPILTFKLYPRFLAAVCLEDEELRNAYYNALLATVPETRRALAQFVLGFLRKVADQREHNRMGPKNLGIVFGPLLLQNEKRETDVYKSFMHYTKYIIKCTKHMVASLDKLFIPCQPIQLVRSLTPYMAKKPGELDVQESSIIVIITQSQDECFSESGGRFGMLPRHFLFDLQGQLKCDTGGGSPTESPKAARLRKKTTKKNLDTATVPPVIVSSPSASKLVRPKARLATRKKKSGTLKDKDFENAFKVSKDIFILLPKWKQDEMLRENGLLDPVDETPAPDSGRSQAHRASKTIPVGPQARNPTAPEH